MSRWTTVLAALIIGIVLAILGTTPQPPAPASSDAAAFSAERAMEHVQIIAAKPHPTGSPASAEVRAYLIAELQALGVEVSTTIGMVPERGLDRFGHWSGTRPDTLTFTNIMGVLPGEDRTLPAVALMAHYDTVWGSPGAPDDTAGIAGILETIRAVKYRGIMQRDLIILLSDGEELGLLGARQFFESNPLSDRIGAIVNLEARGGGGRTTLFQTSDDNGEAVLLYSDAVDRPAGSSLATFFYEILPNDTDLTPALKRDYIAYNFGFIGRPGLYHSPKATPERLDQGALQDMGEQTLSLIAALGNAAELPARASNITFFDVFGVALISYGTWAGWVLLGLTSALHIYCLCSNNRKTGELLYSFGAFAAVLLGAGTALYLLNLLSGAGVGEANYYDRLAAIPKLEVQAVLVCVAALAAFAPLWAGRSSSIGGICMALALQIYAPIAAYIIVWPLFLSGIAGAASIRFSGRWVESVKALCAAILFGFVLQYGHQLMQGVGPDLPSITALLAALTVPMLGSLIPSVNKKTTLGMAAICLILASGMALWVRFDPVADTVAAYESLKG